MSGLEVKSRPSADEIEGAVAGAVEVWGTAQVGKLAEEAAELSAAATRLALFLGGSFDRDRFSRLLAQLTEEAADVLLVLEAVDLLFPQAQGLRDSWRTVKRERLALRLAAWREEKKEPQA